VGAARARPLSQRPAGRDALAAYERARTLVTEELGVDPGPELRELHRKVLAQDPMLAHRPRLTCGDAEDGGMQWWRTFTPLRWEAVV
jgi:Bacterial transcriptional activator domain